MERCGARLPGSCVNVLQTVFPLDWRTTGCRVFETVRTSRCSEWGSPWRHSCSPTASFTSLLCLLHAVPLPGISYCCSQTAESMPALWKLFSHLPWLASNFCEPWGFQSHTHSPFIAFPLFQATLALTDRALCVILTCFLSTGAPNSTSGLPWIINASTVRPQTAHCLIYAGFLLKVMLVELAGIRRCVIFFCFIKKKKINKHFHSKLLSVFVQTLPQDKLHLCGWYSREPPPQTAEQDAKPGTFPQLSM